MLHNSQNLYLNLGNYIKKTFFRDSWFSQLLGKNSSRKLLFLYSIIFVLILLPPLVIRSESAYQLYGDIAACIWNILSAAAIFYTAHRIRLVSRRSAIAWCAIALSLVFLALGNISWLLLIHAYHVDPFPSIADYFYLLSYPLFLIGILQFPFKKMPMIENAKIYLETITVVISMGLFLWFFVLKPIVIQTENMTSTHMWATIAYFSVDTLLFMALWVLITMKSEYLPLGVKIQLGLSLIFLIFADITFLVQDLQGLYYETVRITDVSYNLFSSFLGMAGLSQLIVPSSNVSSLREENYWLLSIHRLFSDLLLLGSFYLFVIGHEYNQLISFNAVSFWVGFLILISIVLQRLDGHEIFSLNKDLKNLNADLEDRVQTRTLELKHTNTELEKAMKAKDEFMAAMSHELRTPLTGILGSAESLKITGHGSMTEKQFRAVGIIETSGRRLLDLVNDLIDYSRLQSGMMQLFVEQYPLADICEAAMRSISEDVKQRNQTLSFQKPSEKIMLQTDVTLMKKMLIHLLRNASKFTPNGGELGIQIIHKVSEQKMEIIVWDRGIGIKESDISKIFVPFVQLDAALSRRYEGTGLGLAIVSKLAGLFHYDVKVVSSLGEGSCFTISLPWQGQAE